MTRARREVGLREAARRESMVIQLRGRAEKTTKSVGYIVRGLFHDFYILDKKCIPLRHGGIG